MNKLVILGNGPSLKGFDFTKLSNVDTFGLNGAFPEYKTLNWYPTYFGLFTYNKQNLWDIRKINDFIDNNRCEKVFLLDDYKGIEYNVKNEYITLKDSSFFYNIDSTKNSLPLWVDIYTALKEVGYKRSDEIVKKIFNNQFALNLNYRGLKKFLLDEKDYTKDDFIKKPRYRESDVLPNDFNSFWWNPSFNSTIMAVLIARILGYDEIYLLGVDCNYIVDGTNLNYKDNYWFDNPIPMNIAGVLPECSAEYINDIHLQGWTCLKCLLYNKDIKIFNCTPNSKLTLFPQSNIEDILC